jgi:hypothetical protein
MMMFVLPTLTFASDQLTFSRHIIRKQSADCSSQHGQIRTTTISVASWLRIFGPYQTKQKIDSS